jgi:uncharacterized repeat protein (TIGR03803 family)
MKSPRLLSISTIGLRATALVFGSLFAVASMPIAQAQTFTVLYTFTGGGDGAGPNGSLIQDAAGNLYGTAFGGGDNSKCIFSGNTGCGTVFKLSPEGQLTVLHVFEGAPDDGSFPLAQLVFDPAGNLYSTTQEGGTVNGGTVFKVDTGGKETVLHSFTGGRDGEEPDAGLVIDNAGNLYGSAVHGGNPRCDCGVVFGVDAAGKETVLHRFKPFEGTYPESGVIRDASGNLYGTAVVGGNNNNGTVFKLGRHGVLTVLHEFNGGRSGYGPMGVVRDSAGNLFGTTASGGRNGGIGIVFKVTAAGKEKILHSFGLKNNGFAPYGTLVRDSAGNLYGTTFLGGTYDHGAVFKLDLRGKETVLHSFTGGADGSEPFAGLLLDKSGNLYGTASLGGSNGCTNGLGCGVVFKITP